MTKTTRVSLAHSDLTALPYNLFVPSDPSAPSAAQIEELDVCNNPRLQALPIDSIMKRLVKLRSLRAQICGFKRFPIDSLDMLADHLVELDMSGNLLTSLPPSAARILTRLQSLRLARNNLKNLHSEALGFPSLTDLDLSNNAQLRVIPLVFVPVSLRILDISRVGLAYVDEALCNLVNLQKLRISGNELTDDKFPDCITRLTSLLELDISENNFSALPAAVWNLSSVTRLDASRNKFSGLLPLVFLHQFNIIASDSDSDSSSPRSASPVFARDRGLSLGFDPLPVDPKSITLHSQHHPWLPNPPSNVHFFLKPDMLFAVRVLDISNSGLQSLPISLFSVLNGLSDSLQEFYVHHNNLFRLPDHIVLCTNLQILDVSFNRIIGLPPSIDKLLNLRVLRANANAICDGGLSISMGFLPSLEILDMSDNNIKSIPFPLMGLFRLKELHLGDNYIMYLPEAGIADLTSLTVLTLRSNLIRHLPRGILCLKRLTTLDMRRNLLEGIPMTDSVADLHSLIDFHLDSNLLCTADNPRILDALKSMLHYLPALRQLTLDNNFVSNEHLQHVLDSIPEEKRQHVIVSNKLDLPNEVIDHLYISSMLAAENRHIIENLGITHILIAARDIKPRFPASFKYRQSDIIDDPNEDLIRQLTPSLFQFIDEGRQEGRCLIHCAQGISRSASVLIAYLMYKQRMTFDEAFETVRKARPFVHPNRGFLQQLRAYNPHSPIDTC